MLDGVVVILDASAGVQAQTELVWDQSQKHSLPSIFFLNKMDKDTSSIEDSIQSITNRLGATPLLIQALHPDYFISSPDCSNPSFIDLINLETCQWASSSKIEASNSKVLPSEMSIINSISPSLEEEMRLERSKVVEKLGDSINEEFHEDFVTAYFDGMEKGEESEGYFTSIPPSLLNATIQKACHRGEVSPTYLGSSLRGGIGVECLLDGICDFLPSPLERPNIKTFISPRRTKNKVEGGEKDEIKEQFVDISSLPSTNQSIDSHSSLLSQIFKVTYDRKRGQFVSFIRIFGGSLRSGDFIFNSTRQIKEKASQLCKIDGEDLISIKEAKIGDVVAIVGLKHSFTGDTLTFFNKGWKERF